MCQDKRLLVFKEVKIHKVNDEMTVSVAGFELSNFKGKFSVDNITYNAQAKAHVGVIVSAGVEISVLIQGTFIISRFCATLLWI